MNPPTVDVVPGQLIIGAAVVGLVFLVVAVAVLVVLVVAAIAAWWRDRRERRLLEDLAAHLHAYSTDYPDIADGVARLSAAVRDEQQEGGELA